MHGLSNSRKGGGALGHLTLSSFLKQMEYYIIIIHGLSSSCKGGGALGHLTLSSFLKQMEFYIIITHDLSSSCKGRGWGTWTLDPFLIFKTDGIIYSHNAWAK